MGFLALSGVSSSSSRWPSNECMKTYKCESKCDNEYTIDKSVLSNKLFKTTFCFPCHACLSLSGLPHMIAAETSFYEAKNCVQVLARKDKSGTAVSYVKPTSSTSSPLRGSYHSARLVLNNLSHIPHSALGPGHTFNIAVPERFNVQHLVLPAKSIPLYSCEFLNIIAITHPASSTYLLSTFLPLLHSCVQPFQSIYMAASSNDGEKTARRQLLSPQFQHFPEITQSL